MNHSDIESCMADYLEGDLTLSKRALFDAHLDGCEDCSAELAAMRQTIERLHSLPTPEPPGDLADNVMRRIAEGEGQPGLLDRTTGWFAGLSSRFTASGFAVPASVLAAGLAVALVTADRGPSRPGFALPGFALPEFALPEFEMAAPEARSTAAASRPSEGRSERLADAAGLPSELSEKKESVARGIRLGMRGSGVGDDALPAAPSRTRRAAGHPGLALASAATGGTEEVQAMRTRDEWLEVLIEQPRVFAREHTELSSVERELWISHLSRRASELQRLEEVVAALRATTDPVAVALADSFAAASATR